MMIVYRAHLKSYTPRTYGDVDCLINSECEIMELLSQPDKIRNSPIACFICVDHILQTELRIEEGGTMTLLALFVTTLLFSTGWGKYADRTI